MDTVRSWLIGIVAVALICCVVTSVAPEGAGKRALKVVCGFAAWASLLSIAVDFSYENYSEFMAYYRQEAEETVSEALENGQDQTRAIIEKECETYILDKAVDVGADVEDVEVSARWSTSGVWYPVRVELNGDGGTPEAEELSQIIESQLGIPEGEQYWSTENET